MARSPITFYRFNLNILNDFFPLRGCMQCILHVFGSDKNFNQTENANDVETEK